MDICINTIIEKLERYKIKSYINNKNITFVESVKYLESNPSHLSTNILYVGELLNLPISSANNKANFLIVCDGELPDLIEPYENCNIIFISNSCVFSIFNLVLDIFSESQKLNENSFKFLEVLSQGNGLQDIVNTGFKLLGNPLWVRNVNFKVLAFAENVELDDPGWNDITSKGYQSYDEMKNLLKSEILDNTGWNNTTSKGYQSYDEMESLLKSEIINSRIPIYFKPVNYKKNTDASSNGNEIGTKISESPKSVVHICPKKYTESVVPRLWQNIYVENKFLGQIIILEAFKAFTEEDIALMKCLSEVLSIELMKHKYYETTDIDNKDLIILDLLDGKIKNEETLRENLKFTNWSLKGHMRIINITINTNEISPIQFNYIRILFGKLFLNSVCVLYKGDIVVVINYIDDKTLQEIHLKKLNKLLKDFTIFCGISRSFNNLYNIKKYYIQSLKAIELGRNLNDSKFIFFYDSYILQHIFSLCSNHEPLKEFCVPSLLKLIDYDRMYNTNYTKYLYSYIMNFKNQKELANLMHVHRNTLYYRLSKIEGIMNIDLNNLDEFFNIYLSFKILEYLKEDLLYKNKK